MAIDTVGQLQNLLLLRVLKFPLALNIFESSVRRGKFDESRLLPDGSLMEISKVYPPDAVYDNPEDVSEDVMILLMMLMGAETTLVYKKFLIILIFAVL